MTVKELIELLNHYDEDMDVVIECDDCEGKWYEIDEDSTESLANTQVYLNKLVISATY